MKLKAGSLAWFVARDLRLSLRRGIDMFAAASPVRALLIAAFGLAALHLLAWPAVPWIAHYRVAAETSVEVKLGIGVFLACLASWMVAQGLFAATRTLFDRGDLDLLYSSPQSPRRILAAKALAIAMSSMGSVAVLALPFANVAAFRLGPHWLAAYPSLLAVALAATSLSLFLTIGLFRLFGPKRARQYAQLGGAAIGGVLVLTVQIVAMLPSDVQDKISAAVTPGRISGPYSRIFWAPVDALFGDVPAIIAVLVFAIALFAGACSLLGNRFATACLVAAGAPSSNGSRAGQRRVKFRAGPKGALRRKEWRLLARDPSLFAQLALQIVYTIPLAVVLVRSGTMPLALSLTPAIVVIAAQISASLAWIAVSGEDAPELIASAPIAPMQVDAAKLSAIALPVSIVAGLPLLGLAMVAPKPALIAVLFTAGASISTALLNLWHPMPGNRRGMLRRHTQSKLIGMLEHAIAILWAIGAVMVLLGAWVWFIPLLLALGVLFHGRILELGARRWRPVSAGVASNATR